PGVLPAAGRTGLRGGGGELCAPARGARGIPVPGDDVAIGSESGSGEVRADPPLHDGECGTGEGIAPAVPRRFYGGAAGRAQADVEQGVSGPAAGVKARGSLSG